MVVVREGWLFWAAYAWVSNGVCRAVVEPLAVAFMHDWSWPGLCWLDVSLQVGLREGPFLLPCHLLQGILRIIRGYTMRGRPNAADRAARAMYARALDIEKPMYFTFRQLTQPEFVGGCALAELAMTTNNPVYARECGKTMRIISAVGSHGNRCSACSMLCEMELAWIRGDLIGVRDLKAWYFSTEEGSRHIRLWESAGSRYDVDVDESRGEVGWDEATANLEEMRAAARAADEESPYLDPDHGCFTLEDLRSWVVDGGEDEADPALFVEERVLNIQTCDDCSRWLFGSRVRGRITKESCMCQSGKLAAKLHANFPLRELPEEIAFACGTNALMRDAYKANQLLCMTAHTAPSSDKIRGTNHPRFNAAFKAAGMRRLCVLLLRSHGLIMDCVQV